MMNYGLWWAVAAVAAVAVRACAGAAWRWPAEDGADSVHINAKVRFLDNINEHQHKNLRGYEGKLEAERSGAQARAATNSRRNSPYVQFSDGSLDSLQYCKCVSTPDCNPRTDLPMACGSGMYLCCFKRPNKAKYDGPSEVFNEVDDERPQLLPGRENRVSAFPAPADSAFEGQFGPGHSHEAGLMGTIERRPIQFGSREPFTKYEQEPAKKYGQIQILVGPDGPTGAIGPRQNNPDVLVGPEGPSGVIGPKHGNSQLLVGPNGPTGIVGPTREAPAVLAGPGGPTGVIGPGRLPQQDVLVGPTGPSGIIASEASAQYNILVGPNGPTGMLGPKRYDPRLSMRQGFLIGPGGPTGVVGPNGHLAGRPQQPGILVGPGGRTGIIGPGRHLLVGPGGPTGRIGPAGGVSYGQFQYN